MSGTIAGWPPADRFRPVDRFTRAVVAMLGVVALLSLVTIPTLLVELYRLRVRPVYVVDEEWLGRMTWALLTATSVAWIAAAGFWLMWQVRAHENLWAAGVPGLRYRPAWSVLWWLVPVANLWKPALVVREIAGGSATLARRPPGPEVGFILWVWWVLWVCSSLSWYVGTIARRIGAGTVWPGNDGAFRFGDRALIACACFTLVSAVLAAIVVREIGADQAASPDAVALGAPVAGIPARPDLGGGAGN